MSLKTFGENKGGSSLPNHTDATDFNCSVVTHKILNHSLETDDDWWRVRQLLVETWRLTQRDFNWDIRRWDGWRFHREDGSWTPRRAELVRVWETSSGDLVGTAHPEDGGDAWFQVHPDYRHLELEMLAWADAHLASQTEGQLCQLSVFAFEDDAIRCRLLEQHGYEKSTSSEVTRRLRLGGASLPSTAIASGYLLRNTRPEQVEYARVADVLNAGFNRTAHTAQEIKTFMTLSPSFRHDLDLVAEASDGSFAAYVGLTLDEENRLGIVEPVCTHPDHLRKGLARTLIYEGLRRLKRLGAEYASVSTGDAVAANQLYESCGFTEPSRGYFWRKVFS